MGPSRFLPLSILFAFYFVSLLRFPNIVRLIVYFLFQETLTRDFPFLYTVVFFVSLRLRVTILLCACPSPPTYSCLSPSLFTSPPLSFCLCPSVCQSLSVCLFVSSITLSFSFSLPLSRFLSFSLYLSLPRLRFSPLVPSSFL